ncbi:MAG: 4-(cytidine 5'-diphospho)-2-C-methyl-D-erythritol kinase [Thermoleophilia bacterium]
MAGTVTLIAPAKLNLCLRVGPVGADGYHPVGTLMVTLDGLHDVVTVRRARDRRVDCPGIDGADNLAWRALDALEAHLGGPLPHLAVRIDKRIPAQAGLGGGSSDAAATLLAARRLLGLDVDDAALEAVAATVGSDVPFFIRGGARWATGRGEVLRPAAMPVGLWVVVHPPVQPLSTARVYAAFDRIGHATPPPADPPDAPWTTGDWVANDLWPAALACAPALGGVARALRAQGARDVLLCGSGGAVAGLFDDPGRAEAAGAALRGAWVCRPGGADG